MANNLRPANRMKPDAPSRSSEGAEHRRYRSAINAVRSRDVTRAPHERPLKYDRENDLYERGSL